MHQEQIWKKIYEADVFIDFQPALARGSALLPGASRLWQTPAGRMFLQPHFMLNAPFPFGNAALFTCRQTAEAAAVRLIKVLIEILLSWKSKRIAYDPTL